MTNTIQVNSVTKVFDGNVAVDSVTMSVAAGSIHGIVGANGAGKTTLLRMLVGLVEPTYGTIEVFGEKVHKEAKHLRSRLHYLGSDGDLYRSFRVEHLLEYSRKLYPTWNEERCQALLDALELAPHRLVRNLSLGMKMQVRLLVALSCRPELLILDEPTNGLDPVVKRQFLQFIVQEAANTGMTVVFATHQLDDLQRIADGVTVMYDGRAVQTGNLDDIKGDLKRVQAVLPDGCPEQARRLPGIVSVEQRGQFVTFVVEGGPGNAGRVMDELQAVGATYTEVLDVEFDEWFRYTMQKEGYQRDGILLS